MGKLKFIFNIPSLPLVALANLYFLIRIIIAEGGIIEFFTSLQLKSDDELENIGSEIEEKYSYLIPIYYAVSTICWFLLIKYIILK